MATYRIGIGTEFKLDSGVGIGTDTVSGGLGDLRVDGTVKTTDLDVTGVSTFTRYAGFAVDNIEIGKDSRDISLTGEHSTRGDIVVGVNSTFTVSAGATVDVGTVPSVSIGTHFSPPTGGMEDRPEVPVEGTVRFNTDVNTLEFYNGVEWRLFTVNGASGRGVFFGGYVSPAHQKFVDYINIQSRGNSQDFGQLSAATRLSGGLANSIRGINAGGLNPGYTDTIEYITIASRGDPIDFGNLSSSRITVSGAASNTRGCFCGGYQPSPTKGVNTIDFVEIMTLGNAVDWGDLRYGRYMPGACSSPTRGVVVGGEIYSPSQANVSYIDYFTIASKGTADNFGDLGSKGYGCSSGASSTRGVFGGMETDKRFIYYITIASTGNSMYFGDLNTPFSSCAMGTVSSQTRGIIAGGRNPANVNTIESVEIATTGNAVDFGDRVIASQQFGGCSDSHGGLGGY